jgi:anaerobic selenocysteine-containing dehydrogenase
VLLSAADHAALGLADEVRLEANGQSLIVPVTVGRDVPQGMVVTPDHFANVPIHRLTTDAYMARVLASRPKGGGR